MPANVKIEGLDEVVQDFRDANRPIKRHGKSFMNGLGVFTVKRLNIHTLNAGAFDLGELITGFHHKLKEKPASLETIVRTSPLAEKYAAPVEFGSKPHRAPIDALRGWAERHGIPVGAVWHKIATEGTEPRWMWRDSFEDLGHEVDSELPKFLVRMVKDI